MAARAAEREENSGIFLLNCQKEKGKESSAHFRPLGKAPSADAPFRSPRRGRKRL